MQRQIDHDRQSAKLAPARFERAAVALYDRFRDGKVQTRPAARAIARAFDTIEAFGEALQVALRNARTAVFPRHDGASAFTTQRHGDAAGRFGVTQVVLEQVREHLREASLVRDDASVFVEMR